MKNTAAAKSGHQKYLLSKLPAADGAAAMTLTATYCIQTANAAQRAPRPAVMMAGIFVFIIFSRAKTPNKISATSGSASLVSWFRLYFGGSYLAIPFPSGAAPAKRHGAFTYLFLPAGMSGKRR